MPMQPMLKPLVRLIVVVMLIANGGIVGVTGAMAETCNRTVSVATLQNSADVQVVKAQPTGKKVMPCSQTKIICSGLVGCAGVTVELPKSLIDGRAVTTVDHQLFYVNGAISISHKPVLPPPAI